MIALDTNVLLRLVLRDDPVQATIAERLMRDAKRDGTPLYVSDAVLCELAWVLKGFPALKRVDIAQLLADLLDAELIQVEGDRAAERAVRAYAEGPGDFADYLIRERALAAGATVVATFDRALKSDPGFRVLTR